MRFTTTIHTLTTLISILSIAIVYLLFRYPVIIVDNVSTKSHLLVLLIQFKSALRNVF